MYEIVHRKSYLVHRKSYIVDRIGPCTGAELLYELHLHPLRDDSGLRGAVQQQLHRLAAALAVVDRPLIHVHPDELVGALVADAAVEARGVPESVAPIGDRVLDAGAEAARHPRDDLG